MIRHISSARLSLTSFYRAPLPSPKISPIPFRMISFAHPHPLTPIESHLYKNGGGGRVSFPIYSPTQAILLFSTASKHSSHTHRQQLHSFHSLTYMFHRHPGWGSPVIISISSPLPPRHFRPRNTTSPISLPWEDGSRVADHGPRVTSQGFSCSPSWTTMRSKSSWRCQCAPIEWKFPGMVENRTG